MNKRPRKPKPAPKAISRQADWQVQTAKARFSELFRKAREDGPQVVSKGGKEAVVILPVEQYDALVARADQPTRLVDFFQRSPLRGTELDQERNPDTGRKISL